jgi:hypothetical protein
MSDFVKQGKADMVEYVKKAIRDLLKVLNEPIVYPLDINGAIQEHKLLLVVKSREQVYKSTMEMIELINIDNQVFINEIISGLKNTWRELTNITTRNIGSCNMGEYESSDIADNYLSSIAQAKELSARVSFQILDRINILEDPESANDEILRNIQVPNIVERYTEN